MEITDEIRETHAALSACSLEFLDYVCKNPECQHRSSFALLDRGDDLVRFPLQSWPTFVSRPFRQEIVRAAVGVTRLIKSIPERFFDADPHKLASYYSLDDRYSSIMVELLKMREHVDGLITRHDFVYSASGFKCLECNMSSFLGGWNTGVFARWYSQIPVLQQFFSALPHGLIYTDTPRNFFLHILQQAQGRLRIESEINVAFVIPSGDSPRRAAVEFGRSKLREIVNYDSHRITADVVTCNYADFRDDQSGLFLGDKRIDIVVEYTDGFISREVFRNLLMGNIDVYNGPLSVLYSDKRNLALLSEALGSESLSAEESSLIREFIPWTRELKPGNTVYLGDGVNLLDLVESLRQNLVLKPARSAHGERVCIGHKVSAAEWSSTVRNALQEKNPWIVQEQVESLPFLYQSGQSGATPHDLVWGFFVFGDNYAGTFLRMLPKGGSGVVNAALGAVEGAIIEVDDP